MFRLKVCSGVHHQYNFQKPLLTGIQKIRDHLRILEIFYHHSEDNAVGGYGEFLDNAGSKSNRRKTNKGCNLIVRWKQITSPWNQLKDLKELKPIDFVDYVVVNNNYNETDFDR